MKELNIIKIGGNVINDPKQLASFLRDFAAIPKPGLLVHGGGALASEIANRLGVPVTMIEGRRVTDAEMLKIVTMVYGGWINKDIVARLQSLSNNAIGLTGADGNCIRAIKRSGWTHDFGFVGDIEKVDAEMLASFLEKGLVPVLAPLTHDGQGNLLNTNADTIAAAVAQALSAIYRVTLVYCFEKSGVLMDPEADSSVIPSLDRQQYSALKNRGVISAGMIPKLDNAFAALEKGVASVHIISAVNLSGITANRPVGTRLVP